MQTVRQLLGAKKPGVWSISPNASVYDALKLMAEKNTGAVLVIDERDRLVGILSERDYARKIVLKGHTSRDTPVSQIMTEDVTTVSPDVGVEQCMAMMTTGHFRHLPVVEDDRVIGVVSIGDLGKAIIANQGFVIDQLERYIVGSR